MALAYAKTVFGGTRMLMAKASASAATASSATTKTAATATEKKGIQKLVPVSPQLGQFLGSAEASRTQAVKKIWEYVKHHNLQNPANKKEIRCDEKLKVIFDGKDTVSFLEMAKLLSRHFVKSA